jgi:plastocyanin/glucose/arabinose dehydrogenase
MSPSWSMRLQRVLILSVAASMLTVGQGLAQPAPAEPGVPPGTQQQNPPDTRPGPPFELEAGYTLTNLAKGVQGIVVGVAADPTGNVYYVTNTCPTIDREAFTGQRTMADAYNGLSTFGYSQLVRIAPDGAQTVLLNEQQNQIKCSVNGLTYHAGKLYIPVMGQILEYDLAAKSTKVLLDNLPWGDHYVDRVTFGPDGKGYFGIGTATNSGVVGLDDEGCCWKLADFPDKHEILPYTVTLTGQDFSAPGCTIDAKTGQARVASTGALVPFGQTTSAGQVIPGQKKANTTINRFDLANPEGSFEVFASGFRHPYGIAFAPDGRLFVTNNGPDIRGCRPIGNGVPDDMWEVTQGSWAGWPEVFGGYELDNAGLLRLDLTPPPSIFTRESRPGPAMQPFLRFEPHTNAANIEFSTTDGFGHKGDAFVTQAGSHDPGTSGGPTVNTGKKIVRINLATKEVSPFYQSNNWGESGTGIHRPLSITFSADGSKLYVGDLGVLSSTAFGIKPGFAGVWMIARTGGAGAQAPAAAAQPQVSGTRVNIIDTRDSPQAWGYQPATINVSVGDTVTWVNTGLNPHSATSRTGTFDTDVFDPGASRSVTFDTAGTFGYFCKPHPWMTGTVVVAAAQAGAPAGAPAPAAPAPPAAPPPPAASSAGSAIARDGQSLPNQSATTQAMFAAVWSDRAAQRWVQEHEAELSRMGR